MSSKLTLGTFLRKYRNDETCLEEILKLKYPHGIHCKKHNQISKFTKVKNRPVYQCSCGYQISPLAGTIFEKSTTPLQYWFYAIFVMANTRSGVSAKQLQRELGVTYKTAWRMFKQIRILMSNTSSWPLDGTVEIDETFVGGKGINRAREWVEGVKGKEKQIIMGMLQRHGKVYLKHVPDTSRYTLVKQVKDNVNPNAVVYSDQNPAYTSLKKYGFNHDWINHHEVFKRGDVHTQNIENFWSHLKRGLTGVYRKVSKKYLLAYADEFGFRYSNRDKADEMFELLLKQIPEVKVI